MKKYFSLFKMRLISGMQYRAAAWAGISTQFFFGFVFIMIYIAFYSSSTSVPPMPIEQLITYVWLMQSFFAIFIIWAQDEALLGQICDGHVAYEFTRPYDLYTFWYFRLVAQRLASVILRFLPVITVAMLLPKPYTMGFPDSPIAFVLFIISLLLSLILVVAISMYIYILTFKTLSSVGSKLIMVVISEFLMGAIIPIPLMPELMQKILNFLPFRYIMDLPFNLYLGNVTGSGAFLQIMVQIMFILVLIFFGKILFNKSCREVVIQGG